MTRLIFALTALGLLSGCGIPAGLERPDPMWGREEALRRECTRALPPGQQRDPRCNETGAPTIDDRANTPPDSVPQAPRLEPQAYPAQ